MQHQTHRDAERSSNDLDGSASAAQPVPRSVIAALDAGDPVRALSLLNSRVRFRFTGVFQVDPPQLRNIHLFDRENPTLNVSGGVSSIDIGYCGIVCATNAPFVTADARHDPRLARHPARDSMASYAGVPIRLTNGIAWGTLCHYDARPRLVPERELAVLEAVAPHFRDWVLAHAGEVGSSRDAPAR